MDALREIAAWQQQALTHRRAGRLDEAAAVCDRILAVMPDAADALHLLGQIGISRNGGDAAAAFVRRALTLEPGRATFLNSLGAASRLAGAERWFRRALQCLPDHLPALLNLAAAVEAQGDAGRAEGLWRAALTLDPARVKGLHGLARSLGGGPQAETALRRALRLQPADAALMADFGRLRQREGQLAEAAAWLRAAVMLAPGHAGFAAALRALGTVPPWVEPLRPGAVPRVAVWLRSDWHLPIVARLAGVLARTFPVVVVRTLDELIDARPAVVVGAEAGSLGTVKRLMPGTVAVHVCHGLASKNEPARHYGTVDYVCVAGEESRERLLQAGAVPQRGYWVTGFVQMDALFRPAQVAPPAALAVAAGRPVILYAPTFNPRLTSATMLGDRLLDRLAGPAADKVVVVKPHPNLFRQAPAVIDGWRSLAARNPDLVLVDDAAADVVPWLVAADLLVTDVSSVAFQYLALDRPIVFIDNPDRFADPLHFDPDGIEWRWRDIGDRVDDVDAVWRRVDEALADPGARRPQRLHRRDLLFGGLTDGRAAERIAENLAAAYAVAD